MNRTARFRRGASAAALVLAPFLLLAAVAIVPLNTGDTFAEMLRTYDADRGAIAFTGLLALAGALLMIPAVLAVMRAVSPDAPVLALVGGSLAIAGSAAMIGLIGFDAVMLEVSRAQSVREPLAAAMEDGDGWLMGAVFFTFLVGSVLGLLLLGVALVRTRVVTAWAGVAVAAALPVNVVGHAVDAKPVSLVALAMLVAGFTALAARVLATPDADWAAGVVAAPRPARSAVPASA